jgi:predicted TPR repeat methyltransferase
MQYELINNQGVNFLNQKKYDEALSCFKQALEVEPNFAKAILNLGFTHHKIGNLDKAVRAYKKVVNADLTYALGSDNKIPSVIHFFSQGKVRDAIDLLNILIETNPKDALLFNMRGGCFMSIGQIEMAILNYQEALKIDHEYAIPKHMLNSLIGYSSKEPPKEYVRNLFDDYAERFNDVLVNDLQYNLPFIIKDVVLKLNNARSEYKNAIDLGCGTGLSGEGLKEISINLTGIDISENMISKAKKLNFYDSLIVGDIVERLNSSQDKFDLFVALDVLIYIGDIEAIFNAVHKCSSLDSLFIFSIEVQEKSGFSLLKNARYAHSDEYIMDQALGFFDLIHSQNLKLRKEGDNWINGKLYVFRSI